MAGSTRFLGMRLRRLISRRDMGLEFLDVAGQVNLERIGSNVSGANGRQQDVYKITNNSSSVIDTHLLVMARGLSDQIKMENASGMTSSGYPYVRVFLPDGVLLPGQSMVQTESRTSRIHWLRIENKLKDMQIVNRRQWLATAAGAATALTLRGQNSPAFKLRYAPRIGWLQGMNPSQHLEVYSKAGFKAFEYNGLPNHSMAEIEQIRKKRDELGMAMGVFVVNRGGWRPTSLPEKSAHGRFLEDLRRAVEIHRVMENECATATSGLGVPHLTFAQQTANCIEPQTRGGHSRQNEDDTRAGAAES